jgi:hypothetical protein
MCTSVFITHLFRECANALLDEVFYIFGNDALCAKSLYLTTAVLGQRRIWRGCSFQVRLASVEC